MNKKFAVLSGVVAMALVGCATTKRSLTNTMWNDAPAGDGKALYLSYWEGSCGGAFHPFGGCSSGESHVRFCSIESDNSMKCEDQSEMDKILNR